MGCASGSYTLSNNTANIALNVAAGGTVYVRCSITPGLLAGRTALKVVDQKAFTDHQADFQRKEVEFTPTS